MGRSYKILSNIKKETKVRFGREGFVHPILFLAISYSVLVAQIEQQSFVYVEYEMVEAKQHMWI